MTSLSQLARFLAAKVVKSRCSWFVACKKKVVTSGRWTVPQLNLHTSCLSCVPAARRLVYRMFRNATRRQIGRESKLLQTGNPGSKKYAMPYILQYNILCERLRWSRGSVMAFSTQVRGFKPGRSLRIFRAKKNPSTPSFGGEVKPSVPRRRFAACKRSLNLRGSRNLGKITGQFLAHSFTFRC